MNTSKSKTTSQKFKEQMERWAALHEEIGRDLEKLKRDALRMGIILDQE